MVEAAAVVGNNQISRAAIRSKRHGEVVARLAELGAEGAKRFLVL